MRTIKVKTQEVRQVLTVNTTAMTVEELKKELESQFNLNLNNAGFIDYETETMFVTNNSRLPNKDCILLVVPLKTSLGAKSFKLKCVENKNGVQIKYSIEEDTLDDAYAKLKSIVYESSQIKENTNDYVMTVTVKDLEDKVNKIMDELKNNVTTTVNTYSDCDSNQPNEPSYSKADYNEDVDDVEDDIDDDDDSLYL